MDVFPDAYGIFLAPYISQKAGEQCRKEGIGYLDLAGNCYLCFDTVYIEQEGRDVEMGKRRRPLVNERAGAGNEVLSQGECDLDNHLVSPHLGRELQGLEPLRHAALKVFTCARAFFHTDFGNATVRAYNQGEDDLTL